MDKTQELQSLRRGLKTVALINTVGSITIAQLSRQLQLARTTAERVLGTLYADGYIDRDPETKAFFLTARVHTLSDGYAEESRLVSAARPLLIEITRRVGWPLCLALPMGEYMSIRITTDSETALGLNKRHVGSTGSMGYVSSGLAFLAFLEEPQHSIMFEMLRRSDNPQQAAVHDRGRMDYILAETRRTGYSFGVDHGRELSVAVPVMLGGRVRGSLLMPFMARVLSNADVVAKYVSELQRLALAIEEAASAEPASDMSKTGQDAKSPTLDGVG